MTRRDAPPPLLRTPPFPHTDAAKVAISRPGTAAAPIDPARVDRLLAAIARARVGGAFWGNANPWTATHGTAADGDSDLVAVAAIRGVPLAVTRPGRFGKPASGPDRAMVAMHILRDTLYRDPFTGAAIEAERAVDLLTDWRGLIESNRDVAVAMGMAWWKRREIATFLWSGRDGRPRFVRDDDRACAIAAAAGGSIAAWPSRVSKRLAQDAAARGVSLIRVEDGFIRSTGLGSGLHPPYSVSVDRLGIHYDPHRPSALEHLLETTDFAPTLIARAAALRRTIVAQGIGKYGGRLGADLPPRPPGRRLVLVAGQVSDDLSVMTGGGAVRGNPDLLARTRAVEPDAEIWFRPHPDVDAGHRRGAIPDADALRHADRVVRGGSMADLLDRVDGLHVITSLSGFEALMRGRDVTAHGTPFYAGWGLTRDLGPPVSRRTRRLVLDELVAATLILSPRYLDPVTGLPCPVETLVTRFIEGFAPRRSWLLWLRSVQGRLGLMLH